MTEEVIEAIENLKNKLEEVHQELDRVYYRLEVKENTISAVYWLHLASDRLYGVRDCVDKAWNEVNKNKEEEE